MDKAQKVKLARKWIRDIQRILPADMPITLSTGTTKKWGEVGKTKKGYKVWLNWDVSWETLKTWVLPHEYAHCRVWGRLQAKMEDHDPHLYLEIRNVDIAAQNLEGYED